MRRLRDIDLRFEFDDLRAAGAWGNFGLLVAHDGADRLGLERRFARIGHQIHADRLAGFRVEVGQHSGLEDDRACRRKRRISDSPQGAGGG